MSPRRRPDAAPTLPHASHPPPARVRADRLARLARPPCARNAAAGVRHPVPHLRGRAVFDDATDGEKMESTLTNTDQRREFKRKLEWEVCLMNESLMRITTHHPPPTTYHHPLPP